VWSANKNDCNHFLKAVSDRLGLGHFEKSWDANRIVDVLMMATSQPTNWKALASADAARADAEAGYFVVAGTRGPDIGEVHGHVAVVVAGPMNPARHVPHGYWGRLGGVGARNCTLNYAWRSTDLHAASIFRPGSSFGSQSKQLRRKRIDAGRSRGAD
jgi:hypothetical protein